MSKEWTREEINYLNNNFQTKTIKQIAKEVGHSYESTRDKQRKMGLRKRRANYTLNELDYIKENYLMMTDKEMALALHRTNFSISSKRKKMKKCCKTNKKYNFTEVENKFLEKDYILISSVEEYNDCSSSLLYICSKHKEKGIQKTTFGHILEGKGCMYCGRINTGLSEQISSTQAMQLCEEKKLYYQGKYIKNKNTNIKFICPKHLLAGLQYMKYSNMKRENIIGCKYCGAQFKNLRCSFGERKIKAVLDKVGVKYIREYEFENCRDILPLPFDFYLPHYNICIEYDGEQHFYPVQFNGITIEQAENNFKNVNYHDNIKDKYCIDNNITLIRISYEDRENIDYILLDQLIKLGILENI